MPRNDNRQQQNIGKPPPVERGKISVGQPRPGFQQPQGPSIPTGPAPKLGPNATQIGGRDKGR